jgi:hypothetical protein
MICSHIVKINKTISQSAGNNVISDIGTSETIRNKTVSTERIKLISIHIPTHLKPLSDNEFGHYLAGLIDGDGHFSSKQQLVIVFNSLDIQLAYFIKKQLGFGTVKKVKNKNAVLFILSTSKGIKKVISLINGKIRSTSKLDQINTNILRHKRYASIGETKINLDNNLQNY